jgi:hypothetical protein
MVRATLASPGSDFLEEKGVGLRALPPGGGRGLPPARGKRWSGGHILVLSLKKGPISAQ